MFTFLFALLYVQLPAQTKTENVVLVTLDGLRWKELFSGADPKIVSNKKYVKDVPGLKDKYWNDSPVKRRKALFPFMWSTLVQNGQIYGNRELGNKVNVANRYWFSYPGYNELLTGNTDRRIRSNARVDNPNQTILEFANQQRGFQDKVAAFASWDVFHYILAKRRSGIYINAGHDTAKVKLTFREKYLNHLQQHTPSPWRSTRLDEFTHQYAKEYMKKNFPKLVLIAYGETDEYAHEGRYDDYLESATKTDAYIKDLWEFIQSNEHYKDKTTLLITTDHGRGAGRRSWRGHGIDKIGSNHTWFAVMGPDTKPLGEVKAKGHYYTKQLAHTIASYLDLNYPNSGSSENIIATGPVK